MYPQHDLNGSWVLCARPRYNDIQQHIGFIMTEWSIMLVDRVGETPLVISSSHCARSNFENGKLNFYPNEARSPVEYIRRVFNDGDECRNTHEYLIRATESYRKLGFWVARESMKTIVQLAFDGEDFRAENLANEQKYLVDQTSEHVKLFHAKMKLLID